MAGAALAVFADRDEVGVLTRLTLIPCVIAGSNLEYFHIVLGQGFRVRCACDVIENGAS
jgi:hypothetical protein